MKLENQVCSLELAQKLKTLGVKQESILNWVKMSKGYQLRYVGEAKKGLDFALKSISGISAFTVAELGNIIGWRIFASDPPEDWKNQISYTDTESRTEANERAIWLIHLLENKLITIV